MRGSAGNNGCGLAFIQTRNFTLAKSNAYLSLCFSGCNSAIDWLKPYSVTSHASNPQVTTVGNVYFLARTKHFNPLVKIHRENTVKFTERVCYKFGNEFAKH